MRVARSSLLGVVLLAAQAGGTEEGVSLESAKQELRQLENTQKSKAGSLVPDRVKMDTPTLQLEGAANPGVSVLTDRKKEDEERARRLKQKKEENWLINGVERLAREETGSGTTTAAGNSTGLDTQATKADPADPQYLLKLFDEQGKPSATKESVTKVRPTPAPDPFAPFLQNWLGSSPVRSQVMDQFRKSEGTAGVALAPSRQTDFPTTVTASTTGGAMPVTTAAPPKANPYLVDSGLTAPTNNTIAGPVSLPAIERSSLNPVPAPMPAAPVAIPAPEVRTPAKAPPSSQADDKKYFPQLNRF